MEVHASEVLESTIQKQFREHAPQVHENDLMKIIRFGIHLLPHCLKDAFSDGLEGALPQENHSEGWSG
jgi:hypothetical protein